MQRKTGRREESLDALAAREQQLVTDVLHLYREGGSIADIHAALTILRAVRIELRQREEEDADDIPEAGQWMVSGEGYRIQGMC